MTSLKENCVFDVVEVVEISSQTDLAIRPLVLGQGGVVGGTGGGNGCDDGQRSGRMHRRGNGEEIGCKQDEI